LGYFLSQQTLALAEHARALGAHSPTAHLDLVQQAADAAQRVADADAAWVASLEAELEQPGGTWAPTDWDDGTDVTRRAWLELDPNGATYRN
jgi:hypothetical protein